MCGPPPPKLADLFTCAEPCLKRSKSVPATLDHGHAEHWAGGLKTLEHSHLSKPVEKDHPVVAATEDWEQRLFLRRVSPPRAKGQTQAFLGAKNGGGGLAASGIGEEA